MKLDFIDHDRLVPARTNMRLARKAPDVADLLPTVRQRGILVPLIVRPGGEAGDPFGIVAGLRRWTANGIVRAEGVDHGPLPCAILEAGDDADALEASMIENYARLDPDEVTQWESFVRLVKEGRSADDIAATFGLPDLTVRRILALGNLLPRIRDLYRREVIDRATVRHLTLASKSQQRAWLSLHDDKDAYAPTGHQLKSWLFGGTTIKAAHALFDIEASGLAVVADLFGEDRYVADTDAFWMAQDAEIEVRRAAYLADGWSDVVILPKGHRFESWEHEKAAKRKGGRVYVEVRATGEVSFHEGWLTRREARARASGEADEPVLRPSRPEASGPLNAYVDLHRHAAVRAALTGHPGIALRLMVAHAVAGSTLWRVEPEPQAARNEVITVSVEASRGEALFGERRRAVLDLLGHDAERRGLTRRFHDHDELPGLFLRLLDLPDAAVLDVVAVVMGESLAAGSVGLEAAGAACRVDMADWWEADDALFDLIRDRAVMEAVTHEVAGDLVARANAGGNAKTLKRIVRDHLEGNDGRERVARWVPRWMRFPPAAYTARGGVRSVEAHTRYAEAQAVRAGEKKVEADGASPIDPVPDPDSRTDTANARIVDAAQRGEAGPQAGEDRPPSGSVPLAA